MLYMSLTLDLSSRWRCRWWLLSGHSYGRGNVFRDLVDSDPLLWLFLLEIKLYCRGLSGQITYFSAEVTLKEKTS